jgi:hypothetical protein
VRAEKKTAEAVVAETLGNASRAKGRRSKAELKEKLKGSCEGV